MLLRKLPLITNVAADLYVIAVGTNDVRYRDQKHCAMTATEYIENMRQLVKAIRQKRPDARIVFIGAWSSDHYDPVSLLGEQERVRMLKEYREALHAWAQESGHLYIDPNPKLEATFRTKYIRKWLKDHIHPNASDGIRLYSQKVLESSP